MGYQPAGRQEQGSPVRYSSTPPVAIVVLTWNQCALTADCVASLLELDYPPSQLQIIVVDNGSVDGTTRALGARFPQITVLKNAENLGFAEGNNIGIRHALKGPAQFVMLLNNDTVVDRRLVSNLASFLQQHSEAGIVGPKMLYYDPSDVIWCAGNRIHWATGQTIRLEAEKQDDGPTRPTREVDFITGCCMLVRREVIEKVGLLDPRFFIYYEETDWCVRARNEGWGVFYVPHARIWHRVSAAMGTTSAATEYYMSRNVLLFLTKHLVGLPRVVATARAFGRSLLAIVAYTVKPHGGQRAAHRNARMLALRDAVLGRWGKMGDDVAIACRQATR